MTSRNGFKSNYKQRLKLTLVHICNSLKRLEDQPKVLTSYEIIRLILQPMTFHHITDRLYVLSFLFSYIYIYIFIYIYNINYTYIILQILYIYCIYTYIAGDSEQVRIGNFRPSESIFNQKTWYNQCFQSILSPPPQKI